MRLGRPNTKPRLSGPKRRRSERRPHKRGNNAKPPCRHKPPNWRKPSRRSSACDLFRQLASALHPDREPDPERRLVKTALMSEANAAHERRDWLALLDIQQRAAISTPASPASDEQLAEVIVLLKQQVAEQERQRAALNDRLADEFDLPPGSGVTAERLAAALSQQAQVLQAKVAQLEAAAEQASDAAALKRWLKD